MKIPQDMGEKNFHFQYLEDSLLQAKKCRKCRIYKDFYLTRVQVLYIMRELFTTQNSMFCEILLNGKRNVIFPFQI